MQIRIRGGASGEARALCPGVGARVSRVDGFESEKYAAKNATDLAQNHPEAYALYDALVTETGGGRKDGRDFRAWFENPRAK